MKRLFISLLTIGALLLIVTPAQAQSETEITLNLSRDFGYSSGTGKIQGTFSMKVSGPENLTRVVFLIDDEILGEDSEAPYKLQFSTGDHPLGTHTLRAIGYTADGRELNSNDRRVEFVSAEEGWQAAGKIILPILGLVIVVTVISSVIPALTGRGKKGSLPMGAPRSYGLLGGAICPKCGRPFSIHVFGLNLVTGRLDRCPHCGKWSLVRRAGPTDLKAAEEAELQEAQETGETPLRSEEDNLRKALDDSKFHDL